MKTKIFVVLSMVLVLTAFAAWTVSAQGPQPPHSSGQPPVLQTPPPGEPEFGKPFAPFASAPEMGAQNVGPAAISLGQPGLSFRYVQTFGVTEEPYLEDNSHFYNVEGIGTDGTNIWITDSWGSRVVKFDANGNFQQKIGKAGVLDYTGTPLDYVTDVAVDSSGNIWVVDGNTAHVVKYDSSGNKVSELGEAWNSGSDNSHFNDPISIAFDSAGNIYISDSGLWGTYGNHRVQVFNSSGTYITTIGQTGVCGTANNQLCRPRGLAIYSNRLYVADTANHRVQIFDITNPATPTYVATLGTTGQSGSDNAHFNMPKGVGVDASYIYVADSENNRVQIFNRNTLAYVATLGTGSGQGNNQFNHPTDVVIDNAGRIYVADNYNKRVQQFNSSRVYQRTYGTTGVSYVTDGNHYYYPRGIAVAGDGSIYIVEERGHRLVKLDANGVFQWAVGEAGQTGSDNNHFFGPQDVAVDGSGRIYTVESWDNHRVQIFNSDGTYYASLGGWGTGNYQFDSPTGITIDRQGNIYVADADNHRVQIYNNQRNYIATLGQTGVSGSDNAHFNWPTDVAVDANGTIYVADEGNDRVQVFDSNRNYVRTIGETGATSSDFGHFDGWGPHNLAVDSQNRLYVSDAGNTRIQVFDSNGAYLTTVGGSDGTRSSQFRHVKGIAIGPDDSLYTAEGYDNHRIQKFAPGVPGWKQVNINGFGDPNNRVSALAPFGGQLYAGTNNFGGNGAQLWRMDASGNWSSVMTNGFGNSNNVGIDHLLEFNGQLYAGIWNEDNGGEVWRSSDGTNWNQVVSAGFGDPTNGEVIRLGVFNNQIYAATWSYTSTHGAEIWRSNTGDSGSWSRVVSNGLGDPTNQAGLTMEEFNGAFYVGTYNWDWWSANQSNGGEVWRTTDGLTWNRVITGGFGDADNYAVSALEVFSNSLYAALSNYNPSTGPHGGEIWRCSAASNCDEVTDWERVVDGGFGDINNSISALITFENHLYAVTYNAPTGIEVWHTADGTNWEQVGFAGLGDSNNSYPYWDNSATVYNNRLFIGTTNSANGGEVWLFLHQQIYLPLVFKNNP